MKQIVNPVAALFILTIFTFGQCKKKKDELPPETQTGANTFGCLVNGQIFLPGGAQLSGGSLNSIYQHIIPTSPSGYTFGVSAKNQRESCLPKTVAFGFDSVQMSAGIYPLVLRKNGKGGGAYQLFPCNQSYYIEYLTNDQIIGELNLKKFDLNNQIASGTFWFDAVGNGGQKIEVREGRFDVRFTR
ncbi:MAG: hypothetical protein ACT4OJ_05120 [Bacteroidota bacterium]